MLAVRTPNKIIPKLVKMADGRMALVHFLVYFEAGELKAKIVSVQYSSENSFSNAQPLAICGVCAKSPEVCGFFRKPCDIRRWCSPGSSMSEIG